MAHGNFDRRLLKDAHIQSQRKGGAFWKPDQPTTRLRFLPGWFDTETGADSPVVFVHLVQHWLAGEENKTYTCPGTPGIDRHCVICAQARKLKRGESSVEQELGNQIGPRHVYLWNVLLRGREADGPRVYAAPGVVHRTILDYAADEVDWKDFLDIYNGHDVQLSKSGTGIGTRYDVKVAKDPNGLFKNRAETDKFFESAPNLTKHLVALSDAELKAALVRMVGDPPEDTGQAVEEEEYASADIDDGASFVSTHTPTSVAPDEVKVTPFSADPAPAHHTHAPAPASSPAVHGASATLQSIRDRVRNRVGGAR